MTTTDADRLEKMHERADKGWRQIKGLGKGKRGKMPRRVDNEGNGKMRGRW